jgi:hypothetical protein
LVNTTYGSPRERAQHRDRARQGPQPVVHPVAERQRPVHVEDEPARIPQPFPRVIGDVGHIRH